MTPKFRHDCDRCRFLGQTLGGCRIHDLYVCENPDRDRLNVTLIARYSDEGSEYMSGHPDYARPEGHAELFAALHLWQREKDNAS